MTNKLTAETITTAQIRALRAEAIAANDYRTVTSCDVALSPRETTDDAGNLLVDNDGDVTTRSAQRDLLADQINETKALEDEERCYDAMAARAQEVE